MMDRSSSSSWDGVARSFHWLMAVLILLQAIGGWVGSDMDRSPLKVDVMTAHKSLGITLLLLVLIRLLWRWTHAAPPPIAGSKPWETWAARLSHSALYLLMIAVPVSGWLDASTSIVPWKLWWAIPWPAIAAPDQHLHEIAGELHESLVWVLAAILAIHVAAALRHHFVQRDQVLMRMLRSDR
jgi:cytochrome b561